MSDYQTVVIGAGPGGYVAAIRLAQLGHKVLVVEKEALGGVCLNWGCIPSKALIYAASLYEKIQDAGVMGILADNVQVDPRRMQEWKQGVVKKLTGGIGQLFKAHGIQTLSGSARFVDSHTLAVESPTGDVETLRFEQCLIATGSIPIQVPGFAFDGSHILESRDALELQEIPASLAVIGGGVIGLEIGILYAKLGAAVTVVEMGSQLLPGVDPEIVQVLSRALKKRGVKIHTQTQAQSAKIENHQIHLTLTTPSGESPLTVEKVLVAVGRRPWTQDLHLEKVGVQLNDKGFIQIDHQLKTSAPHIFAIGDVTGGPLLAHKASKEGLIAAEVMAGNRDSLDYRALPAAIFTDPEIATVGLTEAQAEAEGYRVRVGKFPFQASGRALSMNAPEGLVKVVADAETDRVLGVHMVGADVSELIAEAALAIELCATAEDIALTIHTHPTLPESLAEAAEAVHGKAIHIYQREPRTPQPTR